MHQKKRSSHDIPFGWHPATGRMLTAEEVDRGLQCNCICIQCTTRLVARHGEQRPKHFAHYRATNCSNAAEAAIHAMAKQLVFDRQGVQVPGRIMSRVIHGKRGVWSEELITEVQQAGFQNVTECDIEKTIGVRSSKDGYRRPDLVAKLDGRPLAIEIHNTHAVDREKSDWLKKRGFSILEIYVGDLAVMLTGSYKKALEHRLFETDRHAVWLVHSGDDDAQERLDVLETKMRAEKKDEETKLLLILKKQEDRARRQKEFWEKIKDVEDFKMRLWNATLRIGRNSERVNLKIYGHVPEFVLSKTNAFAKYHGGKFNTKFKCWEFYPEQSLQKFFAQIKAEAKKIMDFGWNIQEPARLAKEPQKYWPALINTHKLLPWEFVDPALRELFEERAGILEYEGGMTRTAAEQQAWDYVNSLHEA